MKVFICTVLFAILAGCYGYSYVVPANPANPGICFWNGKVLPTGGDHQVAGLCQKYQCNADGSINIDGCGPISLPNCTLIVDRQSMIPYPDCCAMTYQCIDANGKPYTKIWNQLYPNGKPVNEIVETPTAANTYQLQISKVKQGESKVVSPFILQLLLV